MTVITASISDAATLAGASRDAYLSEFAEIVVPRLAEREAFDDDGFVAEAPVEKPVCASLCDDLTIEAVNALVR